MNKQTKKKTKQFIYKYKQKVFCKTIFYSKNASSV